MTTENLDPVYQGLSKKIVVNFFRQNYIKKYRFVGYQDKDFDKSDIIISDRVLDRSDDLKVSLFREAVYFIPEESGDFSSPFPELINDVIIGINCGSLSEKYIKENFETKSNLIFYHDLRAMIEDFNNKKLKMVIIDRKDYYDNVLVLPKKYLFFVEADKEFGFIFFKNIDYKNLFELFKKSNAIEEKEWLKFILRG